jgi:adenylate kinase family enzyme
VIIGSSGTGKSTLAAALAGRLGVPHVELDALHWEPNWTEAPTDRFRARVASATTSDAWVVDGNYFKAADITWAAADTLVWLDYPLWLVLWRLSGRTLRRCVRKETLWAGNQERLGMQLLTKDSIFWWVLSTWRRRRREYPQLLLQQAQLGKTVLRFATPHQAQRWLASVPANSQGT